MWIREKKAWESLRVILIDVSVEDYKAYRRERRSSLLDLGTEIEMSVIFSHVSGKYHGQWSDLCHAVKADLYDHDVRGDYGNGKAIEKWRSLLSEWGNVIGKSKFPRADSLYPPPRILYLLLNLLTRWTSR